MTTSRPRAPASSEPRRRGDALLDRLLQPGEKRPATGSRRAVAGPVPAGLGSFWALARKTAPKK